MALEAYDIYGGFDLEDEVDLDRPPQIPAAHSVDMLIDEARRLAVRIGHVAVTEDHLCGGVLDAAHLAVAAMNFGSTGVELTVRGGFDYEVEVAMLRSEFPRARQVADGDTVITTDAYCQAFSLAQWRAAASGRRSYTAFGLAIGALNVDTKFASGLRDWMHLSGHFVRGVVAA